MVFQLITSEEESRIFDKLTEYYQKLYPQLKFSRKEKLLSRSEIGNIYYTYSGEETESTSLEKMEMIKEALGSGYNTPIIILQKKTKLILLDGHRRALFAHNDNLGWKALILQSNKDADFGIEKMITKKVKDVKV
ncbi:MAG: hypothetical protein Q7S22_01145 [Candidatus Micrarchaeota archaeon]|nr:hypothetical protein [Candidatus Micrarchaeota archaeon]